MNCKDCNDTRLYQPLIGPSEPCQACQGPIGFSYVALSDLYRSGPVENYLPVMAKIEMYGYLPGYPIKYYIGISGRKIVSDGNKRLLALLSIQANNRKTFERVLKDGLVPALEILR